MGIIQSLLPTPKEEFPLTGVQRVDDLITNAKEVVAIVAKPEQLMNEFKYRNFDLAPPAEATGLIEQAKALVDAPQAIIRENTKLFEEVPQIIENPGKLLADPINLTSNLRKMIGDPNKVIDDYKGMIGKFKQLGENSGDIIGSAQKYADDCKKLIEDDFQKVLDYLKELPGIVPIIKDSVEKLSTFERDLRTEMMNFSGGLCKAARSANLINHNINSVNKYKKKYQEEIDVAQGIVDQAMEKTKEVQQLMNTAKGYQAQAEDVQHKVETVRDEVIGLQNKAKEWIQRVEDLKSKQDAFKNLTSDPMKSVDQAKDMAQGIMGNVNKFKALF